MFVERIINSIFRSNTYIFCFDDTTGAWVVDPGDSKPILDWLKKSRKFLDGILITHAHFDHIYGVNDLYEAYPRNKIYASGCARDGMFSAKINRSCYTENPFVVKCSDINIVGHNNLIPLAEDVFVEVIDTPGHNNDCLTFKIGKYVFTGDALIPGIKVHTKSKFSDKKLAQDSIEKIISSCNPGTLICPGHGDICSLEDSEIRLSLLKNEI